MGLRLGSELKTRSRVEFRIKEKVPLYQYSGRGQLDVSFSRI